MRWGKWVIALTLIAMLAGASVESSTHDVEAATDAADPAVAAYAADYSVSAAEAARRLARIRPIHAVLAALRAAEPERLAGWGIDHGAQMNGWVLLTGSAVPGPSATQIAGAHSDVEIRTGATYTYAQLRDAQDSFGRGTGANLSTSPGAVPDHSVIITFTSVDMRENVLRIGIDPALASSNGDSATQAELQAKINELEADYSGHLDSDFKVVDGRGFSDDAMFDAGGAMSSCTSGFVARDNDSGDYGVITAGHCGSPQRMKGVTLTWVYGYASITADAEFRRIPGGAGHTVRSQYVRNPLNDPPSVTVVHSDIARSGMDGEYLCHTGMNSGVSCGTVTNTSFRPNYDEACLTGSGGEDTPCSSTFVEVHGPNLEACRGDSGGPWWRGSTAYGIHKGSNNADNDCDLTGRRAWFSAVREVEDFLDVEVLENTFVTVP